LSNLPSIASKKKSLMPRCMSRAAMSLFGPNFSKGGELGGMVGRGMNYLGLDTMLQRSRNEANGFGVLNSNQSLDSYDPVSSVGTLASAAGWFGKLFGFANGGDFLVGGAGGPDSKLAQFRVTPGERIIVQTPQQQRESGGRGVVIYNQFAITGALDRRSQAQIAAAAAAGVPRAATRAS